MYATPKGFARDTNAYTAADSKPSSIAPTHASEQEKGDMAEKSAAPPTRKRLYSQVVAASSLPTTSATMTTTDVGLGINAYADKTAQQMPYRPDAYSSSDQVEPAPVPQAQPAMPSSYAPAMPAPTLPAQYRYRYMQPVDPYAPSYDTTFPPLAASTMTAMPQHYLHEQYHRQTPSDFYEIQPTIQKRQSFWRRYPPPMFTFLFGFLFPPLWAAGVFWLYSKHTEYKRWAIVNGFSMVVMLIAIIVIESYTLAGKR
ncbi:hypothetical protein SYNPS1DRAFT_21099 [Syncephalis pseudoplumigaleata]|uniref:Uncharacterized protein n=1 Tax=Syncephalis pseudoplumigaleata TaxID=1712513 RepID=A0A4V1J252_9FUNG|nr:hypothetical protein SYNPS1DRAFT_21099 [Syncephalis pseudoplumigaleata]|eukprot:RKP27349.1 hypothetical protein SYNPS1DRAFT_21099 [Syncephalis pseudoplumigaleata]